MGAGCAPPPELKGRLCEPSPADLAAFATAAARRYSGKFEGLPRVRYWQGLNEPNLSLYFNPQFSAGKPVSPGLYRTLINRFYGAIKSVDPSNLVLAAGLGPIAVPNATIGPMLFARLLLCMAGRHHPHPVAGNCGGGVHFDIFDIHPYTTGSPTHKGGPDDVELGDLAKLQALLTAADRAGRIHGKFQHTPLWITELSWDSNPPDPGGLSMAIDTRWAAEALFQAWRAGVTHFFWYSLRDAPPNPSLPFSETYQSGLYFRGPTVAEDRPKEVQRAFRFPFVAYHPGSRLTFWGRTPSSVGGKVTIQIRPGSQWRNALTIQADRHGIFRGSIATGYGRDQRGEVESPLRLTGVGPVLAPSRRGLLPATLRLSERGPSSWRQGPSPCQLCFWASRTASQCSCSPGAPHPRERRISRFTREASRYSASTLGGTERRAK